MHHWQVSFRFAVGGLDDFWNVGNGHCLRSDWWWEQHSQWNQRPTRGTNHAGAANSTDGTTGEIDAGANETWQGYMVNLIGMRHITLLLWCLLRVCFVFVTFSGALSWFSPLRTLVHLPGYGRLPWSCEKGWSCASFLQIFRLLLWFFNFAQDFD